jgi:hypothetical protein
MPSLAGGILSSVALAAFSTSPSPLRTYKGETERILVKLLLLLFQTVEVDVPRSAGGYFQVGRIVGVTDVTGWTEAILLVFCPPSTWGRASDVKQYLAGPRP